MPETQREQALAKANIVRAERAGIKRDIRDGKISAADVAAMPMESTKRMTLLELLTSRNRWGKKRSTKLLNRIQMTAGKTLESLTDRQRRLLVDSIRNSE